MQIWKSTLVLACAATLPIFAAATPAAAKIRCDGAYQIVNGSLIATPYCGDNYLASVAQSYGSHVSARAIRNNPSKKEEVCRLVGHDTRVQDICAPYTNFGDHGRRR
ncbi:exported protein of unknown function [Candidatus Filomicrobium marinum]|uniref:Uncharacterized protein n=1 Tax=Candidatus Filomicrobium marinum TaxID=1608628 RepID=A0A0D6JBD1_9HYPH|nr:hypothetical protein [Candidatus Filomicrobium marinum]CFX06163.1 exported protein of unknown function [Candidatus Filomicrobium marinum]CPR16377.1 exported protein of unknown function [Candidatus Filomicrobium marinum]